MKKLLLKSAIFSCILVTVLLKMDSFFLDNHSWDVSSFNTLYNEEKHIDIIFIGNSHLNKGIDPLIIDAKCKTNSIKITAAGINIAQVYFNLKEALTVQEKPKLVAIETFALIDPHPYNNRFKMKSDKIRVRPFNSQYFKRFGSVKLEEISSIYNGSEVLFHSFNFFRFHDKWTNTKNWAQSLSAKLSKSPRKVHRDHNRNIAFMGSNKKKAFEKKDFDNSKIRISEDEKFYLTKILDLIEEHKLKLVFFTVPVLDIYYQRSKNEFDAIKREINDMTKGNTNVYYLDLNEKTTGLDRTCVLPGPINTNQHLNYKGAIKTSNLFAKYINNNFDFNENQEVGPIFAEDMLYSKEKIKKDSTFKAYIESVNKTKYRQADTILKSISVPKNGTKLSISGWMYKNGIQKGRFTRKLALKKNNNFIFILDVAEDEIEKKQLAKRLGVEYRFSGFRYEVNTSLLEKGKYKLYSIIETDKGEVHIKDMWKWILIE